MAPTFTQYRTTSGGAWADWPAEMIADPGLGCYVCDDFINTNMTPGDKYEITATDTVASSWALLTDEVGGVLQLDTQATDNQGVTLAANNDAAGFVKIVERSNQRVWFEVIVKINQIASGSFMCGLVNEGEGAADIMADDQSDTAILDTSEPDFVGFITAGDSSPAGLDAAYMSQGTTGGHIIHQADAHTWVADTYVRLGLYFDGRSAVRYYVNGAQVGTDLDPSTTEFPDGEELTFLISVKAGAAATAKQAEMDFWRAAMSYDRDPN